MDLGAVPNKKFSEHFPEAFLFGGFFEGFVYNFLICEITRQISSKSPFMEDPSTNKPSHNEIKTAMK